MNSLLKKTRNKIKNIYCLIKNNKHIEARNLGLSYMEDDFHKEGLKLTSLELKKTPFRYDIINYLLETFQSETSYLEIGVRYPEHNFNKIKANRKYSVDPGAENEENPVDFKFTSDDFFERLRKNEILNSTIKFDVIFIDGLHLAEQVERDIENSLNFIKDDGFIVLHDCNPPTSFHASELYEYRLSPALGNWNGTTWKAFYKYRLKNNLFSCCIDTDWGVGIISKTRNIGDKSEVINPFYEYNVFNSNRKNSLGLISFGDFKKKI